MVNRVKAGIPVYQDITLIPFTGLYTDFNGNNGLRQLVRSAVKKMASVRNYLFYVSWSTNHAYIGNVHAAV